MKFVNLIIFFTCCSFLLYWERIFPNVYLLFHVIFEGTLQQMIWPLNKSVWIKTFKAHFRRGLRNSCHGLIITASLIIQRQLIQNDGVGRVWDFISMTCVKTRGLKLFLFTFYFCDCLHSIIIFETSYYRHINIKKCLVLDNCSW